MSQNKMKFILCHTVILCLVFQEITALNKTVIKKIASRTFKTVNNNASVIDDQHRLNITIENGCEAALQTVKLIYRYSYPAALVIVSLTFGMLLEVQKVGAALKRPFGPFISIFCNYIFSPLLCFGFAEMFFPDDTMGKQMLFMSGFYLRSSLSICWTRTLGGNIELSIIMCIVNTILYFITKPLWIDTLDTWTPHIGDGAIVIANENHTLWNTGFRLVALAIGVLIQFICPKFKKYAIKYALCISLVFIIFYTTFMVAFHLITWFPYSFIDILKINFAGWVLSIMGYMVGYYFARLFKQNDSNTLAIAVESNIPNEALGSTVLPMMIHYTIIRIRTKKTQMMDETNDASKCSSINESV